MAHGEGSGEPCGNLGGVLAHGVSLQKVLEESFSPWVYLGEILGGESVGSLNSDGLWGVGAMVVWGKLPFAHIAAAVVGRS